MASYYAQPLIPGYSTNPDVRKRAGIVSAPSAGSNRGGGGGGDLLDTSHGIIYAVNSISALFTGSTRHQRREARKAAVARETARTQAIEHAATPGAAQAGQTTAATGSTPVFRATQSSGTTVEDVLKSATRTPADVAGDIFGTVYDALGIPRPSGVLISIPGPNLPGGRTASGGTSNVPGPPRVVTVPQVAGSVRALLDANRVFRTATRTAPHVTRQAFTSRSPDSRYQPKTARERSFRDVLTALRVPLDVAEFRRRKV